jgi:signal transduction histidine kinase
MSARALSGLSWVNRPAARRTIRLRLTALYSGLFLVAGALLLAVIYLLVANHVASSTNVVSLPNNQTLIYRVGSAGAPPPQSLPGANVARLAPTKIELPGYLPLASARAKLKAAVAGERANERSRLLLWSGIALGLMVVISAALGWLMAGRVLRPLRTMTARARRISDDNLHERLALAGPNDELKELGDTFDAMLGRLQSAFEAQRRFVANASHELRTPLTLERTMVEVALADPRADADSLRRACEGVLVAGEQQERLIEGLLTLARSQRGLELEEPVDLREISLRVLAGLRAEPRERSLQITSELTAAGTSGDGRLVERLVANLLDNAVRHNVAGGWVRVWTGLRTGRPTIIVSNSGRRISPDEVERLLEPFRRVGVDRAGDRNGHGLGLSIVAAIAAAHGAMLHTRAQPNGGLDVTVSFSR